MLINDIFLRNVKCFASPPRSPSMPAGTLPTNWVVIYGDNGLGKSSLLRAIGMSLTGPPALNALLPSAEGWVRSKQRDAGITVKVTKGTCEKSAGGPRARALTFSWALIGQRPVKQGALVYAAHTINIFEPSKLYEAGEGHRKLVKSIDNDARIFNEYVATEEPKRG